MASKIENIKNAARQVFGESDYSKYLEPSFSTYEKDDYKMLLEQFNSRQKLATETGRMFDQKAAFGEAMLAVDNYKQELHSAPEPDEFNSMFTSVYEAAGYNDEGEEYSYGAGEVDGTGWNAPSATFASKLGEEGRTVLGYHLGTGGDYLPAGKQKSWQRNIAKAEKAGLLSAIKVHKDSQMYADAKALGGEESIYQQLTKHNDIANTDMFTNSSVSIKKDLEMRDKNRKSLNAMARAILPQDAPREWRMATMQSLFKNIPKFRRANNIGYAKFGIQSGYKSDMFKALVEHAPSYEGRRPHLPRFMQENNNMTREEWNAERLGLQGGLDDVWDYATAGGDKDYGHLFDRQEDNIFLNQIDELSRVADENSAAYLSTGSNKDLLQEKDSNILQSLGVSNTAEGIAKLREYKEGSLSLEDVLDPSVEATNTKRDLISANRNKNIGASIDVLDPTKDPTITAKSPKNNSETAKQLNDKQAQVRSKALGIGNVSSTVEAAIQGAQVGVTTQQKDDARAQEILRAAGLDVSDAPQRSPQWHEERRGILTGSTAQAMAGNPKGTTKEILNSQAGIEKNSNIMFDTIFQRGQDAEEGIQNWLAGKFKEAGNKYGIGNTGLIRDPANPNIGYSPDGVVFDRDSGEAVGLSEYKSVGKITRGDEAWSKKYENQVQMGMALSGLDKTWHVQHRAAKGPWDTEEYHAREVARDPEFDTNMNKIAERKELLNAYKGKREDKDLINTLSNLSNKDIEKFSNLYNTADGVKSESDKERIKNGLLEAYETMAREGGDKYPAALSNRKREEEKAEKAREKEEKKKDREESQEKRAREAKYHNAFGNVNRIFGGGSQQMMSGATDVLGDMGIAGDAIKTGINVAKSAFITEREFRNSVGLSMDAGYESGFGLRSARASLESLGLDENQATHSATTISSARNTALLGDVGGLQRIVAGTRGLLSPEDIMVHGENPAKLFELFSERAKNSGWSQGAISGAAELSGLNGFARGYGERAESDYSAAQELRNAGDKAGNVPQQLMKDAALNATQSNVMINAGSNDRLESLGWVSSKAMETANGTRNFVNEITSDAYNFVTGGASATQRRITKDYGKDVLAAAQKYGVDPAAIFAMIEQESGGDPNAVNKKSNAKGILQFTPESAKLYGIDPLNPSQSIDATARGMKEAQERGLKGKDVYRYHHSGPNKAGWKDLTEAYGNDVAEKTEGFQKLFEAHKNNPSMYQKPTTQDIKVDVNIGGKVADVDVSHNGNRVKRERVNIGGGN